MDETLRSAFGFFEAGNISQAESLYRKVIDIQPSNFDALFMLGAIYLLSGNYDLSISFTERALQSDPANASAYYNLGVSYQEKDELDKSILYYQKAVEFDPALAPAYCNLGTVFQKKNEFGKAVSYYMKALELDPALISASYNLGSVLQEKGDLEKAAHYYKAALGLDPGFADAWNTLGSVLQEQGKVDEAVSDYLRAIECDPNLMDAYYNLGKALMEKGRIDEAIDYYRKALQLSPDSAEAHNNLGFSLLEKGRPDEALSHFRKAVSINPEFSQAYYNLALYHQDRNLPDEAVLYYEKAVRHRPDYVDAHWNMACALLLSGNFERGWKEYEWRWKLKKHRGCRISRPQWDGSDISGRTILLHAEQAFGDAIQFIRYAPLVGQRGAKVIVQAPKELVRLLGNVSGIAEVVPDGGQLPEFDLHCPLLSLPLVFGTTLNSVPAQVPYIDVDASLYLKWRERLRCDSAGLKIGLVWAGRIKAERERRRSCPLDLFKGLMQFEDTTFYSLQKGKGTGQVRPGTEDIKLVDYTEDLDDFSDTAALAANLDLIISVDTAAAHLAGAIGKPVWTLLPFVPDWRWMLDREDSPWYPTMRLFRQPSPGNWEAAISDVARELGNLLKRT